MKPYCNTHASKVHPVYRSCEPRYAHLHAGQPKANLPPLPLSDSERAYLSTNRVESIEHWMIMREACREWEHWRKLAENRRGIVYPVRKLEATYVQQ